MQHYPLSLQLKIYTDYLGNLQIEPRILNVDMNQTDYPWNVYMTIADHYKCYIQSLNENRLRKYFTDIYKAFNIELKELIIKFDDSKYAINKAFKEFKQIYNNFPSGELK